MRRQSQRGAALIEFALVALILYLLLAGTFELGRIVFISQVIQDAARVGARELSLAPLGAADTFDMALMSPLVKSGIWDASKLVLDASDQAQLDAAIAALPLVNRALLPAMITDKIGDVPVLRYPGALVPDAAAPFGVTVKIPRLNASGGYEMLEVFTEVRAGAAEGPFSATAGTVPNGIAAVLINYPFQAASLTAFQNTPPANPGDPPEPNMANPIEAPDGTPIGTYSGDNGLGAQYALGKTVRPFRSLLTGQSIFRREVLQ